MTLTLDTVLRGAGIDPAEVQVLRHAYVKEHEDSASPGIHADSTDDEIMAYTANQSANTRKFPTLGSAELIAARDMVMRAGLR